MNTLPTTLSEIREIAMPWFKDPAVHSVNIDTAFGQVTVHRNGDIFMA
jgi:hypothetical protein